MMILLETKSKERVERRGEPTVGSEVGVVE